MSNFSTHFETETVETAHKIMMSSVEQAQFVKSTIENELTGFMKRVSFASSVNAAFKLYTDEFAEAYHAAMNNTICSGSGGSGWDQKDKGESKLASFVNNKKCSVCNEKNSYFADLCHECGSQNFTMATDARWGVKAKSHVKYLPEGLKEYRLMTVKPLTSDLSDKSFLIEDFVIDAKSPGLNALIESQLSSPKSSDSLNFHPPKNNVKTKTGRNCESNINFFLCEPKQTLRAILTFPNDCANIDVEYVDYVNPRTVKSTEYTSSFEAKAFNRASAKGVSLLETDICDLSDEEKVSLVEQGALGKDRGKTSR